MSPSPPYRILYIEDDPQVSDLFRMAIEERGGSVDVAADGKDGLAKHFADPYDVVVTDYRLPDMTGLDVAGALLADNEDLPVIMVTGKGNERIAAEALTLGITNYVIKDNLDVYLALLPAAVQSALARARERKKQRATEAQLRESEARWRRMFEDSATGMVLGEMDGKIAEANPAFCGMLGYTETEMKDLSVIDLTHPDDREGMLKRRRAYAEGKADFFPLDKRYIHKDGHAVWVHGTASLIRDAEGEPRYVLGQLQDVTGQKKSEELLRVAVESMPEGFLYFDADDRLAVVNSKIADIYPLAADVFVLGVSYEKCMRTGVERGQWGPDGDQDEEEWIQERLAYHYDPKGTFEFNLPDGRCIRVEEKKTPQGGIVGVRTDITELKRIELELREARDELEVRVKDRTKALSEKVKEHRRAEEALRVSETKLRAIMENIVEAVLTIGEDGTIETFNPSAEEMFGYDSDEVLGENVSMLAEEPDRSAHDGYLRNYLETGEGKIIGVGFREVTGRRKDGSTFMAELAVNEVRQGRRRQFVGTLRDVTERKQAEESLRSAKERAEFANRAKTEFLAHMSHELRTPLNAILGYSDILHSQMFGPLGSDKYPEYVANIRDAGGHLLGIISDILDVSKVEAGELEVEDGDVDVCKIVQDCKNMVQEKADLARVGLSARTAKDLPRLRADGKRVKQILLNLLTNAIKFTPPKGKVTVQTSQDKAGAIVIQVSDTGIGIAAADIPKILQPFGQVKNAYVNNTREGSGLGLPLVKSLIEIHGGTIEIDSAPGEGTRVSVTFPLDRTIAAP